MKNACRFFFDNQRDLKVVNKSKCSTGFIPYMPCRVVTLTLILFTVWYTLVQHVFDNRFKFSAAPVVLMASAGRPSNAPILLYEIHQSPKESTCKGFLSSE